MLAELLVALLCRNGHLRHSCPAPRFPQVASLSRDLPVSAHKVSLIFHLLGGGPFPRIPEPFTISAVFSLINTPPLNHVALALFTCVPVGDAWAGIGESGVVVFTLVALTQGLPQGVLLVGSSCAAWESGSPGLRNGTRGQGSVSRRHPLPLTRRVVRLPYFVRVFVWGRGPQPPTWSFSLC